MRLVFKGKSLFSITYFLCALFLVSCSVGDSNPPAQITDLTAEQVSRVMDWTAPGDSGNSGKATLYLIRYLDNEQVAEILGVPNLDGIPFAIIQETVQDNFNKAIQIPDFQEPEPAGSAQSFLAPRLDITGEMMFFYTIVTNDEVGNSARPSNVVEISTPLTSVKYISSDAGSCIGESVGAGNFDGEQQDDNSTINDIAIGDPCLGRVYIFYGQNDLTDNGSTVIDVSTADVVVIGNASDMFGASLAGIPDFDSDIRAEELVIGAPGFDNGRGKAFVIFGSRELPSVIDLSDPDVDRIEVVGENVGDGFGFSVADGDDVSNGSGLFVVGAPNFSADTGRTYLFRGRGLDQNVEVPATEADATFTGVSSGDMFGFDLANLGRIRRNSFDELGVGAPGAGRAYVIQGQDNIQSRDLAVDTNNVVTLVGSAADSFGFSISGDGDIDQDGTERPDVVVGAPDANMSTGAAFLYSGDSIDDALENGGSPIFESEYRGTSPGDLFGTSVGVMPFFTPELNFRDRATATIVELEQSNADLLVGAPGTASGDVYVFFGSDSLPVLIPATDANITLVGEGGETDFGLLTEGLGDVNGDDFEDFAAGGLEFLKVFY